MTTSLNAITKYQRAVRAGLHAACILTFSLAAQQAGAWPNLKIVKSGPTQAAPGDVITYTLNYSNIGPVKSTSVQMKDFLPTNVTALTNTLNGGTLSGSTITWSLGSMNSGASGSRSFQVLISPNASSGSSITNRSQIFGSEAEETGKTNDNYSTLITGITGPPPDFCRAILAKQPISLHGSMVIDSFNSGDPNLSTNGRYDGNKRGAGGNVASISDSLTVITDTGNTKVYGRFETGPAGTVRITGNASVGSVAWVDGGNRGIEPGWYLTNLSATIPDATLPGVTFTTLPKTAGNVGGTNYTYVLNTGNYVRTTDLTLSSSEKMVINGNVVMYLQKKFTITGSAFIYITPGSKLTVYLAGTTSLAGGGTVNGTGLAANCAYVGLPTCTSISFTGNSEFIGTVYAPQAIVQMSGGGSQDVNFIGAVVAKTVDVTGNYQFHYDQYLCRECLPPTVLTVPVSLTNCPGTTASFSVTARGTDLRYAWFKDNTALAGRTNSTLTLINVTSGDAGTYKVVVNVPCGDAVTNSATLTINTSVNASPLTSLTRSAGGSATFSTSASGTGPFSYIWRKDGSIIPGQTTSSLTVNNISRNDAGTYSVEVTGACGSVIKTATLTVLNSAPVALNDQYSTPEDTLLTIAAPGVLGNDSDPDGDVLTAILVAGPTHGTLVLNPNGSFTYRPNTNYNGPDSFTYRANDGTLNSGIATVTFNVTPVNDAPVAQNDAYTLPEDTLLTIAAPGVLGNDSDPDGDVLTAILVAGPTHGTLVLNPNGSFTYRPNTNYNGPDSFTYRANDGTLNSEIVTVTFNVTPVNDAPIGQDDSYQVTEDTTVNIPAPGVLSNDSDPDGDVLTAILATSPAHGTLTLNPDGSFTYRPNTNYNGLDSFTYRANDGQTNSGLVTVTLTVLAVNDAPIAQNDTYTLPKNTLLTVAAPGVLANDSDPDGDVLTAILVAGPTHGTLVLNPNGSFTYRPNTNYNGPDSFTYRANDGTLNSEIVTVTFNVTPVNDAPVALNDQYSLLEDTTLSVTAPGVLANDSDPDGDPLRAILVAGPSHGTLTLNTNGGFIYTPVVNFNGMDSFSYRASDGQTNSGAATVTLLVTPVNDPPNTNNWTGNSFTVLEDTVLNVTAPGVLAGITDVDGDSLSVVPASTTSNGVLNLNANGSFTYTPATNYYGPDSFQFRVSDGTTNTGLLTANITVLPVNDEPSFTPGSNLRIQQNAGAQTVPAWATGITPGPANESAQIVTFIVSNNNGSLFTVPPAVSSAGTLTYTPAANVNGTATVTIQARDNGGVANGGVDTSAPRTFSITVNAPPTVSIVSPTNGASFFVPGNFAVLADAQDADGNIVKVEFFSATNKIGEVTSGAPYFTMLTNLPVGTYTFGATATDDFGATGTATPVTVNVIERPPLTLLTSVYYNPQKDFFEQRVRISNPTYSTLDAVRVLVFNLTNSPAITIRNRTGFTNDIPYVQSNAAVPPGSYVDLTIEFSSPLRILPNPILRAELVPPTGPVAPLQGTFQRVNRGLLLANRTFLVEFPTITNRLYSIQYTADLVHWKTAAPAITGTGNWVQWIDNGEPKTESHPAAALARYYRLILLP